VPIESFKETVSFSAKGTEIDSVFSKGTATYSVMIYVFLGFS
jgi:hypothetical protein